MTIRANGSGTIIRLLVGALAALVVAYAGWTVNQVTSNTARLTQLEQNFTEVRTLLKEIQSQSVISDQQVIRRLERIEDRLER